MACHSGIRIFTSLLNMTKAIIQNNYDKVLNVVVSSRKNNNGCKNLNAFVITRNKL